MLFRSGRKKRINEVPTDVYGVFIDGSCAAYETKLGEQMGEVVASKVPEWLYAFNQAVVDSGLDFKSYVKQETEAVKALILEYSH